jgi:hypothetical protein
VLSVLRRRDRLLAREPYSTSRVSQGIEVDPPLIHHSYERVSSQGVLVQFRSCCVVLSASGCLLRKPLEWDRSNVHLAPQVIDGLNLKLVGKKRRNRESQENRRGKYWCSAAQCLGRFVAIVRGHLRVRFGAYPHHHLPGRTVPSTYSSNLHLFPRDFIEAPVSSIYEHRRTPIESGPSRI